MHHQAISSSAVSRGLVEANRMAGTAGQDPVELSSWLGTAIYDLTSGMTALLAWHRTGHRSFIWSSCNFVIS